MTVAKRKFQAMGTTCSVSVYGSADSGRRGRTPESFAALGEQRVMLLEALWSRFRQDSELSRLNAHAGQVPMSVSKETETLVRAMLSAWQATDGAFDPTVLHAMQAAGYDRDFAQVIAADCIAASSVFDGAIPGMSEVAVGERSVRLSMGVSLDPGDAIAQSRNVVPARDASSANAPAKPSDPKPSAPKPSAAKPAAKPVPKPAAAPQVVAPQAQTRGS